MDEYIRKVKIVAFDEIDKVLNGNWDSGRKLAAIDGINAVHDTAYNKALYDVRDWMLETFGGDDGTGNLDKIYKHLEDMQIPMEVGD